MPFNSTLAQALPHLAPWFNMALLAILVTSYLVITICRLRADYIRRDHEEMIPGFRKLADWIARR